MSKKLRLVISNPGWPNPLRGSAAIRFLCAQVSQFSIMKRELPLDFHALTKFDRLRILAQYLPKHCRFTIVRERRWERKNKSLYVRILQGKVK